MIKVDGKAISLLHSQLMSGYDIGDKTNYIRIRSAYSKGRVDNQARNVDQALYYPYVQVNSSYNWAWMVFDLDYDFDYVRDIADKNIPIPNYIITNPNNGHVHLMYGLIHPVYVQSEFKESKPLKYAKAVYARMSELLSADRHFSQSLIKNPLHTDHVTYAGRDQFYTLGELASHIDVNWVEDYEFIHTRHVNKALPVAPYEGAVRGNRNQSLFDHVRRISYQRRYLGDLTESEFEDWVIDQVMRLDLINEEPLQNDINGEKELMTTARSIARWTYRHLKPGKGNGRSAYTDKQRALSLKTRRRNASAKIKAVKAYMKQHKGASNRSIAKALGYSLGSINRYVLIIKAQAVDKARKIKEVAAKTVQTTVSMLDEQLVNQVVQGYLSPAARCRRVKIVWDCHEGGPSVGG